MQMQFSVRLAAGLAIVVAAQQNGQANVDQATAVKAQSGALATIRSFDVSYDCYYQTPADGGAWSAEAKSLAKRWSKNGVLERCRLEGFGRLRIFNDSFFDGTRVSMLSGWNPHDPPKITPRSQQRVRAAIQPTSEFEDGTRSALDFLFAFRLMGAQSKDGTQFDEIRTLEKLVAQSPKVDLRVEPPAGKQGTLIVLTVAAPGVGDDPPNGNYFVIVLDPAVNYMVRRVEGHNLKFPLTLPGRGRVKQHAVFEREVTRFRNFGEGAFFPVEVQERTIQQSTHTVVSKARIVATTIVVNQPLPKDAFDFRFPNNAVVTKVLDNNRSKAAEAWLWGPDNKPAKQIRSRKDLLDD
jgi:hypothetical protein